MQLSSHIPWEITSKVTRPLLQLSRKDACSRETILEPISIYKLPGKAGAPVIEKQYTCSYVNMLNFGHKRFLIFTISQCYVFFFQTGIFESFP